jgi:hypothetical protein
VGEVIDNTQDTPMIEADDAIDAEMEEVAGD